MTEIRYVRCRHCQREKVNRPRGLCWGCYYKPGVRVMYPSTSKYGNRYGMDFNDAAKTPRPTSALPGSEDKIRVMIRRGDNQESIFHPQDAQIED